MSTDTDDTTDESADTEQKSTDTSTDTTKDATTTDTAAEAAKWKDLARKHEERAKANSAAAKELAELRKATMSETEKAITEAKDLTRREVLAELGGALVDAEVRTAAVGRQLDVDTLVDGLDRSRFLGDDGKPDRERIAAWVDKLSPKGEGKPPAKDMGQGARKDNAPPQIRDRGALKNMTAREISTARREGRLDTLMGG